MRRPTCVLWSAMLAVLGSACGRPESIESHLSPVGERRSSIMLDDTGVAGRSDQWVRGTDNMLWRRYSEGTTQHDWQYLGNNGVSFSSDPTAASWGRNRVDVFVVNRNGTIDHGIGAGGNSFWWADNWGSPWQGAWLSGIEVVSPRYGVLDLFVQVVSPTGHGS